MNPLPFRRLTFALTLAATILGSAARGEVTVYPATAGITPSADYRVRVDGRDLFVYPTAACSFASFGLDGEADVVIDVTRPIARAVVRPLSRAIKPAVDGNGISFRVNGTCQLAIEVDDDLRRPLFLFANPMERSAPASTAPGIRYFEGGKVHEAGTIHLGSDETVYIAGGAVVRGVIRADRATNARIAGPGILDASTRTSPSKTVLLTQCRNVSVDGVVVTGSLGWSVMPRLCENVTIRNMKVIGWRDNDDGCDPDSSRHVLIDHCFFRTQDDCVAVKSHVDPAATGTDLQRFITDDVRVSHCVLWNSDLGHAMTIGDAIRGPGVRNVVFTHCDLIKKRGKLPALSIDNHDLGAVENVRFEDVRVEDGCERLLALKVAFSEYSADCPLEYYRNNPARKRAEGEAWEKIVRARRATPRGTIHDVTFKDIQVTGDIAPTCEIRGWSDRNEIDHVVFERVTLGGRPLTSPGELNLRVAKATGVRVLKP